MLADRLLVLEDGQIVQSGPPAQVARQPATPYVARLVGLNLYRGRADASGVALADGGDFAVPGDQRGEVLVAVRPGAIAVSAEQPPDDGRIAWPARVTGLTLLADAVRLTFHGKPPAQADVPPAAVAELSLSPGSPVWLAVRPADLETYPG